MFLFCPNTYDITLGLFQSSFTNYKHTHPHSHTKRVLICHASIYCGLKCISVQHSEKALGVYISTIVFFELSKIFLKNKKNQYPHLKLRCCLFTYTSLILVPKKIFVCVVVCPAALLYVYIGCMSLDFLLYCASLEPNFYVVLVLAENSSCGMWQSF